MCEYKSTDWISESVFVICVAFSLLSFVITAHRSGMPDGVKRNNFKRAAAYPRIPVITGLHAPHDSALFHNAVFFPMACFFECSSGCLNVLCFAIQSCIASRAATARQSAWQLGARLRLFSRRLCHFGGVDIVDVAFHPSCAKCAERRPSTCVGHVIASD